METDAFRTAEDAARRRRIEEHDRFAEVRDRFRAKNRAYYAAIERLARFVVPEGSQVLEIGSGTGDLLAALKPADGTGIDIAPRMVEIARAKHAGLRFQVDDAERLDSVEGKTFDYVVISDVVGMLRDVWAAFRALRRVCHPRTRVLVTYYNFAWEPILRVAQATGNKMPIQPQNWLGMQDLANLLELNHFEVIRRGTTQLVPVDVPGV
ncbi:MAG: class I SAM-dependent methyltransferase, partial [Actinobacteria bacterium]|nr:class I SAM-dependent methyltransferase [Actinomycetota bacterium]